MKHWMSIFFVAAFTFCLAGITGCEQDTSLPPMEGVEDAANDAADNAADAANDAADAARDAADEAAGN